MVARNFLFENFMVEIILYPQILRKTTLVYGAHSFFVKWNVCLCKTLTRVRASFFFTTLKPIKKIMKKSHDWIFMDVFVEQIGISFGNWCNIKWNARGKAEVGFSNVWCRWKWSNRYSGNDKNSTGMIESVRLLIFLIVLLDAIFFLSFLF